KYEFSIMFLLARLLFIHLASVATPRSRFSSFLNTCIAAYPERSEGSHSPSVRYGAFWEIQKPLFSMGLNGCKDNTLTNSIFLYYPLNLCVYNSQSHFLSRVIAATYPNSAESKFRINICSDK